MSVIAFATAVLPPAAFAQTLGDGVPVECRFTLQENPNGTPLPLVLVTAPPDRPIAAGQLVQVEVPGTFQGTRFGSDIRIEAGQTNTKGQIVGIHGERCVGRTWPDRGRIRAGGGLAENAPPRQRLSDR